MDPIGGLLATMAAISGSTWTERAVVLEVGWGKAVEVAEWKDLVAGATVKAETMPTRATKERINRMNLLILELLGVGA